MCLSHTYDFWILHTLIFVIRLMILWNLLWLIFIQSWLMNRLLYRLVLVVCLMILCQLNRLITILFLSLNLVVIISFHSTKDNIRSIIWWQGRKNSIGAISLNLLRCLKISFLLSILLSFGIWILNSSFIYSLSIWHLYRLIYLFLLRHLNWLIFVMNSTLYRFIFVLSGFKSDRNDSISICLGILWLFFVL